jgi:transposase
MKRSITMFIGCDLGDKKTTICVLDEDGQVAERAQIPTTKGGFERFFAKRDRARVVLEVGVHSRWTSSLLTELGHEVVVANPRQVRLIYQGRKKNDQLDAEALARLGRVDVALLSPVKHRSQAAQNDLAVVRARDSAVKSRTQMINCVRSMVKTAGSRLPTCDADSFHKKVKAKLPDELRPALLPLLAAIEHLTALIRGYDKQIEELARCCYPETERLTQVDGVGPLTALAFVLTLEDAGRFPKARQVGAYLGLTPGQAQSGDSDPQLRISKAGDEYMRRLLVGCAHHILGPFGKDSDLRRFGLKLVERGGKHAKKRAVVAVARKLSVLLCKLWVSGEPYVALGYRVCPKKAA